MNHDKVEVIDSIYAIILIDMAMETELSILNLNITVNSMFPEKPFSHYREMIQVILDKLGLDDILQDELARIDKFKENKKKSRFFYNKNETKQIDETVVVQNQNDKEIMNEDMEASRR